MPHFEKTVLRLLCMIVRRVASLPGSIWMNPEEVRFVTRIEESLDI